MTKNVLIVGGGRVGRHVAEQLSGRHKTVTVVERDPAKCTRIAPCVARVVEGDVLEPGILEEAVRDGVDVVAALTNDTETNLTVCYEGKKLSPSARTILRIAHEGEQDYGYLDVVDSVVYPAAAGAAQTTGRISANYSVGDS